MQMRILTNEKRHARYGLENYYINFNTYSQKKKIFSFILK